MPARKKPSPPRASVTIGRVVAWVRRKKNTVLPMVWITIIRLLPTVAEIFAVTSRPAMIISQVTDTMFVANVVLMMPVF